MKFFIITILILLNLNAAIGQNENITPLSNIGENITGSFWGYNSLYHIAGIGLTAAIVETGLDTKVHNYFHENQWFEAPSIGAVFGGYTLPLILGGGLAIAGDFDSQNREYIAGCAVLQSAGIALAYSTILKAITGRPNPTKTFHKDESESKTFNFGFMENGVHYGWPSGHLMVNTAMTITLMEFYDNQYINIAGLTYIAYLLLGITAHEQNTMHWFSDIVCGTLMGYAIGKTVGSNFKNKQKENSKYSIDASPMKIGITINL